MTLNTQVELEIHPSDLVIRKKVFGKVSTQTLPYSSLDQIKIKDTTRSGSNLWWDMMIKVKGQRRPVHLRLQVSEKAKLLWLVDQIKLRRTA